MTRIDVAPATFDATSKVFGQTVADTLFGSFTTLWDGLSGCGGMAGTDPGGTQWGSTYDNAVIEITEVTQDVLNGVYRLAGLLEMTGFNHGQANSASTPGGTVQTTDTASYDCGLCLATLPSASGGSGSTPHGWHLIAHLVGYVWPNGHQDKLRAAASAWSAAARSVSSAADKVPAAVAEISRQTSPEVADATHACNAMGTHLSELSDAYRSMSTACGDYARHLDDAHSQVVDELKSLLEWTAGLEIGGGLLAVVTAGLSEAAANTALAARCAVVAARVGEILTRLLELAGEAAEAIKNALARVIEISRKLKPLLSAKFTEAAATAVARLQKLVKTPEELATDGALARPGPRALLSDYFRNQRVPTSSELEKYAQGKGWTRSQTETGPIKYTDNNGVVRLTLKKGSPRAPGSKNPHVEIRDAQGNRIGPYGKPVTRKSPDNHTPIRWDGK